MIRCIPQTPEGRHKVLGGLVGLFGASTPQAQELVVGKKALRNSGVEYAFFDKFGLEQTEPNENSAYAVAIKGTGVSPVWIRGYDKETQEITISPAIMKPYHSDKVKVESHSLAQSLQLGERNTLYINVGDDPEPTDAIKTAIAKHKQSIDA